MKEPCVSCSEKENDLGGCRCQAFLLSGDAEAADPICTKSPHRHLIDTALKDSQDGKLQAQPIIFRTDKNSKSLIEGDNADRLKPFKAMP